VQVKYTNGEARERHEDSGTFQNVHEEEHVGGIQPTAGVKGSGRRSGRLGGQATRRLKKRLGGGRDTRTNECRGCGYPTNTLEKDRHVNDSSNWRGSPITPSCRRSGRGSFHNHRDSKTIAWSRLDDVFNAAKQDSPEGGD